MLTLYGIPNCNTMKKARAWLDSQALPYRFHDYKKAGVDPQLLKAWSDQLGWEALINRRGTTWRRLPQAERENLSLESALLLMQANPSVIKRPILARADLLLLGFDEDHWRNHLLQD